MNLRAAIALVFAAAALAGCQSTPASQPRSVRQGPAAVALEQYSVRSPYAVMDSPGMRYAPFEADAVHPTPWWYDRNDARLNLRASQGTADSTTYTVEQVDRQQVFGTRVYDVYQRNSYSWRVGRLVQ